MGQFKADRLIRIVCSKLSGILDGHTIYQKFGEGESEA